MFISSTQNSLIKNLVKIHKNRDRRKANIFLIEGARELSLAINNGYIIESVFVCKNLFAKTKYPNVLDLVDKKNIYEIADNVFAKIAYRDNFDGIIALAKPKDLLLSNLSISSNPFIIVLESVEKPGNLGAIIRTADAAAADAVIICDIHTDLYNPNVIRSSIGTIFTTKIAISSSVDAYNWLKDKNITTFAAELKASEFYQNVDFTKPSAIVMGTESDGLTDFWINNANKRVKIPMRGKIDSLNVSVSTAIITFEAMRQREFII